MSTLLALEGVSAGYGESVVVDDVTLAIGEGECVALLGRNGVGKTTLLATIVGETRMHRGMLRWRSRDVASVASTAGTAPAAVAACGGGFIMYISGELAVSTWSGIA